jgi:prevent-host-death family protein
MVTATVAEAGRHLSRLVAAAEAGEEVVITRRGKPAARLTAARPAPEGNGKRAAAALAGRLAARRRWPTDQQVEATIAEAREAWGE